MEMRWSLFWLAVQHQLGLAGLNLPTRNQFELVVLAIFCLNSYCCSSTKYICMCTAPSVGCSNSSINVLYIVCSHRYRSDLLQLFVHCIFVRGMNRNSSCFAHCIQVCTVVSYIASAPYFIQLRSVPFHSTHLIAIVESCSRSHLCSFYTSYKIHTIHTWFW